MAVEFSRYFSREDGEENGSGGTEITIIIIMQPLITLIAAESDLLWDSFIPPIEIRDSDYSSS